MRDFPDSTKILAGWPISHQRDLILVSDPNAKGLMRMPAVRDNSGPLWVDGSIALRVRDKRQRSWRMVKIRHPYATLGSHPKADLVIPRDGVADHHVFLFLDERGLFGVDLRTESGTRFAGTTAEASWLGSGDLIEVGDHTIEVIQLRVNGSVLSGPLSDDDPLGLMRGSPGDSRSDLTLRHLNNPNANWSIGSSLVFLGRGPACAVQVTDELVGLAHSALLRDGAAVYLVQFPGETTQINAKPAPAAVRLNDGDVLTIGRDKLLVQTHEIAVGSDRPQFDNLASRLELAVGQDSFAELDFSFGNHQRIHDTNPVDYPALIGRLQAETAALVAVLLRRIEALDEEMAALRARMDLDDQNRARNTPPPVEKLRWDLIPQADPEAIPAGDAGVWLVDRLRELEAERHSTWSNLIGRLGSNKSPG